MVQFMIMPILEVLPKESLLKSDEILLQNPPENNRQFIFYLLDYLEPYRWSELSSSLSSLLNLDINLLDECLHQLQTNENPLDEDDPLFLEKKLISRSLLILTPKQLSWLKTQTDLSNKTIAQYVREYDWCISSSDKYAGLTASTLIEYLKNSQPDISPQAISQKLKVSLASAYRYSAPNKLTRRHQKVAKRRFDYLQSIEQNPQITPSMLFKSEYSTATIYRDLLLLYMVAPGRRHLLDPSIYGRPVDSDIHQALNLQDKLDKLSKQEPLNELLGLSLESLSRILKSSTADLKKFAYQVRPNKLSELILDQPVKVYPYMYEANIFLDRHSVGHLTRRLQLESQLLTKPKLDLQTLATELAVNLLTIYNDLKIIRLLNCSAENLQINHLSDLENLMTISQKLDYWLKVDLKEPLLDLSFEALCKLLQASEREVTNYSLHFQDYIINQDIEAVTQASGNHKQPTISKITQSLGLPQKLISDYLRGLNLLPNNLAPVEKCQLILKIHRQMKHPTISDIVAQSGLAEATVRRYAKNLDLTLHHKKQVEALKIQAEIEAAWQSCQDPSATEVIVKTGYAKTTVYDYLRKLDLEIDSPTPSTKRSILNRQLVEQTYHSLEYPTLTDITIQSDLNASTVRKYIKDLKLPLYSKQEVQGLQTQAKIKKACQTKQNPTVAEIARETNYSKTTVRKYMKSMDLLSQPQLKQALDLQLVAETHQQMEYPNLSDISQATNLTISVVERYIKELDLKLYDKRKLKALKTQAKIKQAWQSCQYPTIRLVAQATGYARSTVSRYLKELNLAVDEFAAKRQIILEAHQQMEYPNLSDISQATNLNRSVVKRYIKELDLKLYDKRKLKALKTQAKIKKAWQSCQNPTITEITQKTGYSRNSVKHHLKELNLTTKFSSRTPAQLSAERQLVKKAHRQLEYPTLAEITKQTGFSVEIVKKYLHTLGLVVYNGRQIKTLKIQETIKKAWQSCQNPTVVEITQRTGYSRACVTRHLKELNLAVDSKPRNLKQFTDNQQLVKQTYYQLEYPTLAEMVKQTGLNATTVRRYIKTLGLTLYHEQRLTRLKIQKAWDDLDEPTVEVVSQKTGYAKQTVCNHLKALGKPTTVSQTKPKQAKNKPAKSVATTKQAQPKPSQQKAVYPPLITAKISNGFRQRSAVAKHLRHKYIQIILDHRPEIVASLKTGSYQYIQEIADMLELKPMQINFDLQSMEYLPKTLSFDLVKPK